MHNTHTTKGISIIHDKQHNCIREGRRAAAVLTECRAAERIRWCGTCSATISYYGAAAASLKEARERARKANGC